MPCHIIAELFGETISREIEIALEVPHLVINM